MCDWPYVTQLPCEPAILKIACTDRLHVSADEGRSSEDTYALVNFASGPNPAWDYVSLERAIEKCGVEEGFFLISPEDLQFGR